jgi:hypothetical protein
MLLHRREITVIMQQPVLVDDAVRPDDQVGGLANGES